MGNSQASIHPLPRSSTSSVPSTIQHLVLTSNIQLKPPPSAMAGLHFPLLWAGRAPHRN